MKQDGNVIYGDFGNTQLEVKINCDILFADEILVIARVTLAFAGKQYVQHIYVQP